MGPTPAANGMERIAQGCSRRLRVTCVKWREALSLISAAYDGWLADRAPRLGAALAFYSLLSMTPMLVVVIAIAGLAYGQQAAEGRLVWEIQGFVGQQGASWIQSLLKTAHHPGHGLLASAIGLTTLFFGATAFVSELSNALNTIWHVPAKRDLSTWRTLVDVLRRRFVSFAIVVGIGFLLLALLIVNAWVAAITKYAAANIVIPRFVLQLSDLFFSFLIIAALFALVFKLVPDLALEWGDVLFGAVVTAALFSAGRYLIGLYLTHTKIETGYGAAGSLVLVLVWVYYSAQVFFFGAEFTCVYTHRYGSIFRKRLEVEASSAAPVSQRQHVVTPEPQPDGQREIVIPESLKQRSV